MDVRFLTNNLEYDAVLAVLLQLRPTYTLATLAAQVEKQRQQGYQVVYVVSDSEILAVAGFCWCEKLGWGKAIYIDDLVTNDQHRSCGVGRFLMSWFKQYAKENGGEQIHLDSGVERFAAHRFYLREGFHIASHHFSLRNLDV
ncbi:MAG: GNAT family N-acetyltransferase [Vibrio sp.]